MGPLQLDQYQQFKCRASRTTVSHPAVPLGLSDVRFVARCDKTSRDAFSASRRQTESHPEQILAQVSLNSLKRRDGAAVGGGWNFSGC